jgi:hypothetical protein
VFQMSFRSAASNRRGPSASASCAYWEFRLWCQYFFTKSRSRPRQVDPKRPQLDLPKDRLRNAQSKWPRPTTPLPKEGRDRSSARAEADFRHGVGLWDSRRGGSFSQSPAPFTQIVDSTAIAGSLVGGCPFAWHFRRGRRGSDLTSDCGGERGSSRRCPRGRSARACHT